MLVDFIILQNYSWDSVLSSFSILVEGVDIFKECLANEECNGFNYNSMEQKCETFLYSAEHQLSADNDGWTLWLPGMFSK